MKRGIFLFFVFIGIFLMGSVSASHNCGGDPNQIILRLSDVTNAHGEVYNGAGNYPEEICFNEITGSSGTGNRVCDGSNLVLKLSANTNAHAESPFGTSYTINICYTGLSSCFLSSTGCLGSEIAVVGLSDVTNAHLGTVSGSSYSNRICCRVLGGPVPVCGDSVIESGEQCDDGDTNNGDGCDASCQIESGYTCSGQPSVCVPVGGVVSANWTDMQDNVIDGNDVYIGNSVKLVASGVPVGNTVNFEIFDADCLTGEPPCIGDDDIRTGANALTDTADATGRAEVVWTITQEDYDAGGGDEAGGSPELELYFTANDGASYNEQSAQIFLQPETQNIPPVSVIANPKHRQMYFTNTQLEFNQSSFDIDGIIVSWKWTITEDSFTNTESSFVHSFSTAGLKTITLKVTDNQGRSGEQQIAILILKSPGMLAFINAPRHHEIVRNPEKIVLYLANDSYVVNTTGGCSTTLGVDCIAGNCPLQTGNSPNIGSCDGLPINVVNAPLNDFSNLYFNWTFYSMSGQSFGFNTGGFDNESGLQRYDWPSNTFNDKLIALDLSNFNTNLNEKVERVFTLLEGSVGESSCIGNLLYEFNSNGNIINVRNADTDYGDPAQGIPPACAGPDGIVGNIDDCSCSISRYSCTEQGCQSSPINRCSDYLDESSCNNDTYDVADDEELWDELHCDPSDPENSGPSGHIECSCAWKTSECVLNAEFIPHVSGGEPPLCTYNCTYLSEELSSCSGNYIELGVTTDFEGDVAGCGLGAEEAACNADEKEYQLPCGRPEIELPFFGMMQFAISFVFFAFIYLLIVVYRWHYQEKE